tara:strand:+ start:336 stop:548 length:213 start_codon:yes stop_codon:yes gene_type:complete
MENIYQKIEKITKINKSHKFEINGEKFKTFIDFENDFCLTHYGKWNTKNGENSWCVYNAKGLENKINNLK